MVMRYTSGERRKLYGLFRWRILRRGILARDNWRCTACGKMGRLEVHHRHSPFSGGDMWDPDNLETLCRACHWDRHRDSRKRQRLAGNPEQRRWWSLINEGLPDGP